MNKRSKAQPHAYKHNPVLEKKIREGLSAGLTQKAIMDSIQYHPDCPAKWETLYRVYGEAIEDERYRMRQEIGNAVMNKVREGDSKMIEFAARSKAGWNPVDRVQEVDGAEVEEDMDAVTTLASILGKDYKTEE